MFIIASVLLHQVQYPQPEILDIVVTTVPFSDTVRELNAGYTSRISMAEQARRDGYDPSVEKFLHEEGFSSLPAFQDERGAKMRLWIKGNVLGIQRRQESIEALKDAVKLLLSQSLNKGVVKLKDLPESLARRIRPFGESLAEKAGLTAREGKKWVVSPEVDVKFSGRALARVSHEGKEMSVSIPVPFLPTQSNQDAIVLVDDKDGSPKVGFEETPVVIMPMHPGLEDREHLRTIAAAQKFLGEELNRLDTLLQGLKQELLDTAAPGLAKPFASSKAHEQEGWIWTRIHGRIQMEGWAAPENAMSVLRSTKIESVDWSPVMQITLTVGGQTTGYTIFL